MYYIDLPPWLSGLAISGRGAVKAWLAIQQGVGFCMRLFSGKVQEGPPVSSLNCDRPSHLDRRRLGVVRAAGVDNRWQGPADL